MRARRLMVMVAAFGAGLAVATAAMSARVMQPGAGGPGGGGAGGQTQARDQSLPVKQHTELQRLVGEYTTVSKLMVGGSEAMESEGTAKVSSMLEGRFISMEETGETMGLPSKSFKMWGYNSGSRKYESVWTYTRSTAMMTLTGTAEEGKPIALEGGYDEADGRSRYRVTLRIAGEKSFVVEMIALGADGSEVATLQTTYTRKG